METRLMNSRRNLLKAVASLGAAVPLAGIADTAATGAKQSLQEAELNALRHRISGPDQFPPSFNPMAGNPLQTRADVVRAIKNLYLPLTPYYSKGGARVRLDMAGSMFDPTSADLEGFARPLWGLAPLAAGGGADFVDWDLYRRGLANGTNPEHPEYWGACADRDQRLVELASLGFALSLIPKILWEPQSEQAKKHIAAYFQNAYARIYGVNNWMFFRLMIGLGLKAMGESFDPAPTADYEKQIDALYLDKGWYRDGPFRRADYYVPFAFHYYSLLLSRLDNKSPRVATLQSRAKALAPEFQRWFADDGAALAFGRSLTYRFACASYWSALAFADIPALPWGQIKGLVLRHLRWWSKQPIAHRDGVLSLGYAYPNQHVIEHYSSACSPYWAFKVFAFMALPESHSFWTSKEEALPEFEQPATLTNPGMVIFHPPGDAIALCSGQEEYRPWLRLAPEKYSKFAYSARYGFCVETVLGAFDSAALDNMLGFSTDGRHFKVRESNQLAKIADKLLYARWAVDQDITVETWLLPSAPWHVRVHRIMSKKNCQVIEGGFAIGRPEDGSPTFTEGNKGSGLIATSGDFSGIRDLGSSVIRKGRVIETHANANLINANASIPQLMCDIKAGETLLFTAVLALGDTNAGRSAWARPPVAPKLDELRQIIRSQAVDVGTMKA